MLYNTCGILWYYTVQSAKISNIQYTHNHKPSLTIIYTHSLSSTCEPVFLVCVFWVVVYVTRICKLVHTMHNEECHLFLNSNMKFNNSIIYSLKLGLDYKGGIMAYVLVVTQVAYATFDAELAVSCQIIFPS